MFRHRPAMKFAAALSAGIVIGWHWTLPVWLPFALMLPVALLLGAARSHAAACAFARYRGLLVLAAVLLAGAASITVDGKLGDPHDVGKAAALRRRVGVRGVLSAMPRITPRSVRLTLDAESLSAGGRTKSVTGKLLVTVRRIREDGCDTLLAQAVSGTAVSVSGLVTSPAGPRNPGEFDRGAYLRLNDVTGEMFVDRRDTIVLGAVRGETIAERWVYPARRWAGEVIDRHFRGEEAQFLKGLVAGERSEIAPEVKSAFIDAGVMHILAVSGLHVVIVSMMLLIVLETLRVPEKVRLVLMTLLLAYYALFTGATASVLRSVLMALILLFARSVERRADIYNVLAVSAVLILLVDARQLFQPGFQLSYVAVFSLVYFSPKLMLLGSRLPARLRRMRVAQAAGEGLAVSVGAGLGTIPFGAYYFGKISLVGFAANLVIVPLSNLILALGMLTLAVAPAWAWLAGVYAAAASFSTMLLLRSVELFAGLPFAYVAGSFGAGFFVASYALLAVLVALFRSERRAAGVILALALANFLLWSSVIESAAPDRLRVTALDVGQGDAILLEFPGGRAMLVDAGPRSAANDAGERTVLPFLRWSGVGSLDALVVTHPHADHIGGAPSLLRSYAVGLAADAGGGASGGIAGEYRALVDSLGVPHRELRRGDRVDVGASARCYVLSPSRAADGGGSEDNRGVNNRSVVLKVVYGAASILLSGDAEAEAEEDLVGRFGAFLRSGVLKTGHHGSRTSTSEAYLDAVRPQAAIVSVGERNTFGHPSPEVIARLERRGIAAARTDRGGAVVFESDGEAWMVVRWR